MNEENIHSPSPGWILYVKTSFIVALIGLAIGLIFSEASLVEKGYFAICSMFLVSTSFTLAKTMRDEHEANRLINRISEAKTSRILKEYDPEGDV